MKHRLPAVRWSRTQPRRIIRRGWAARLLLGGITAALSLLAAPGARGPARAEEGFTAGQLEFFEKKIRPVLVTHCYQCHAADSKSVKGGLLLDSRSGLLAGGDSGPAIVPGKADESLLLAALRYESFEMPPQGKLSPQVLADFARWIRDGAADPRKAQAAKPQTSAIDIEAGRAHWAYRPVKVPAVPAVNDRAWPRSAIDHFILARLEADDLRPAPDAERSVLARRLYFDLTGLPPTPAQLAAFGADTSPGAYERLVEQLLASPRFGEHWGRHWLDVARFAESLTLRGLVLNEAWRYRDYVIDAFNRDRPFDRFLTEQLAGDLIDADSLAERRRNLIATTFLTLGNSNLEDQDKKKLEMDYIDEQLDVIGRGLLAQTITCARCHDHKFDPIPTRDYYALAGILKNVNALEHANVSKWVEVPLPLAPAAQRAVDQHRETTAALRESIAQLKQRISPAQPRSAVRPVAVGKLPGVVVDDADARKVGNWKDSQYAKNYVGDGYCHDENQGKGAKTLTFLPKLPRDGRYEVRFAYNHSASRAAGVPVTIFSADGEKTVRVNQQTPPAIDGRFVSLGVFRFEVDGQSYVLVSNQGTSGYVIADAVQFLPVDDDGKPLTPNSPDTNPPDPPGNPADAAADLAALKQQLASLETKLKQLQAAAPEIPKAMTVVETGQGADLPIHIRGNVHNLGEVAPRGVLQVTTYGHAPTMPSAASGRRELADWLVAPEHPLTSRVLANRVWHWLFGAGLVRTVDNFGTTGEAPSHPELLDYLASGLVQENWSVKQLIRRIVLSRTYRLSSSVPSPPSDPENRLLSHMNRNRLDAESLRDAMLAAGGRLQFTMGGRTFPHGLASDYKFQFDEPRRSVYAPVFRNSLPEIFEVFDFANPSMVTGRRNVSTVAPQALFLMNHPFVREQAAAAARRMLADRDANEDTRIRRAYWLILGRPPSDPELAISRQFLVDSGEDGALESWTQFIQSLLASIDFRYVR